MTKIKFCGMQTLRDIEAANEIMPEYAGFVFAPQFRRFVSRETFAMIRSALNPEIKTVGVFVDNPFDEIAGLLKSGIIDFAQLHGSEDEGFILRLQEHTLKPIIKAFKIETAEDIKRAKASSADFVLLDSGTGTGRRFDWSLIRDFGRNYFLAGGLCPENVSEAIEKFSPYAVDVSSGIETDMVKDKVKMQKFAQAVRKI